MMNDRTGAVGGSGRRGFLRRTAAGAVGLAAGLTGLRFIPAAPHERITVAAALKGRAWGIDHYLVRWSSVGASELLHVDLVSADRVVGMVSKRREARRHHDTVRWRGDEIAATFRDDTMTADFERNGVFVGSAQVGSDKQLAASLAGMLSESSDMLRLSAATSLDVSDVVQRYRRMAPTARQRKGGGLLPSLHADPLPCQPCYYCAPSNPDPGNIVCSGEWESCGAFAWTENEACDDAKECVDDDCWDCYNPEGCCDYLGEDCDCQCTTGEFACYCVKQGRRATCDSIPDPLPPCK